MPTGVGLVGAYGIRPISWIYVRVGFLSDR